MQLHYLGCGLWNAVTILTSYPLKRNRLFGRFLFFGRKAIELGAGRMQNPEVNAPAGALIILVDV